MPGGDSANSLAMNLCGNEHRSGLARASGIIESFDNRAGAGRVSAVRGVSV